MAFFLGLAWLCTVAWLLTRAVRQFNLYQMLPADAPLQRTGAPSVTVIVPARNESAVIAECVSALLTQDYASDRLRTVVVDDNSTDDTAAIVRRIALSRPNLDVMEAGRLPGGWAGKPHACWQAARSVRSEWLCFMDADTVADPALLRCAVSFAEKQGIDLLSLEPFLILKSFWDRIVIPAGLIVLSFMTDLKQVNDPNSSEAFADGQFILIRRAAYEAMGGHEAVCGELSEDSALARLVKQAGFRTLLLGGGDLIRVRMYNGLRALWHGMSKNGVDMVHGAAAALAGSLGALLLGWIPVALPVWIGAEFVDEPIPSLQTLGLVLALFGSLAMLLTHLSAARHFKIPAWCGLLFPLGLTIVSGIALDSVVRRRLTGGVVWKDRVYSAASNEGGTAAVSCREVSR